MRYASVIVMIFFLTDFTQPLSAQPVFKNYTVSDGLVANYVRRIYQDSKGFLWIATWEGLSKYDGHQFTNYNTSNGLSHNMVNDFYESEDGKLYVATNGGGFDIISGNKVTPNGVPSAGIVNRFLKSSNHPVIVSTDGQGLQEFRNGTLIKPKQSFPRYSYSTLLWVNDSLFIATSNYSVQVFNTNYQLHAELRKPNTSFFDTVIYKDAESRIWAGSGNGLKLLTVPAHRNTPLKTIQPPSYLAIPALQRSIVNDIFEDANGTIWIGTTGGLAKISSGNIYQFFTTREGLISDNITSIYQDREKNIWFGTSSGLSKLVVHSDIRMYKTENGLLSNSLYVAIPVGKDHVLVSSNKGVQLFDKTAGIFRTSLKNDTRFFQMNRLGQTDTVVADVREQDQFDLATVGFQSFVKDKEGNLFAGNSAALYCKSPQKRNPEVLLKQNITSLLLDEDGFLWIGTWDNGLYRLRYSADGSTLRIKSQERYLQGQFIRSLFQDSEGNIWAGTRYAGVFQLKKENPASVFNVSQTTGLMSNWISGIAEDRKGNIWLASYMGLDKLIQRDKAWHVFNFSRINNYFANIVSVGVDGDNILWLATTEGMAQIKDGEMEKLPPLPVYITKIRSPDSVYSAGTDELNLDYHHNQIQFEFSAPGFINEKQIAYSYRLTGSSSSDWADAGNQHTISYANLQPGSYYFEVRTKGWNGEWGKPADFSFSIDPPFWQTAWFKILIASSIAALIVYVFRRRIKAIRHESEMKQKISEMEMMALRAQMNPHFIFNSLNSIDNLIQSNQKEKATIYFSRFAKLIRSILENSKYEVIPCWKDIETLELYLELENLRWDKKFVSEIKIDERIQQGDYKVPPMVIQPYVENAIQHGLLNKRDDDCRLFIEVKPEDKYIKYIVEDNGVGRAKAGEYKLLNRPRHTSMGMQLTEKRIQLFNKDENGSVKIIDLYHDDKTPAGTRVEIFINNNF